MFRYLKLNKRKGQFFIISAVIIVSALFSIYAVYRGYYEVDGSIVQGIDSSYRLNNIIETTKELHNEYNESNCFTIRDNLDTYKTFIERSISNAGDFVKYDYNSHRGCLQTDFDILVKTKDSKVETEFSMGVEHTKSFWVMDTCSDFADDEIENSNIDCVSDKLILSSGANNGNAKYQFVPSDQVIWYKDDMTIEGQENVTIRWYSNKTGECPDSPNFCQYNSFEDLPEKFQWIRVEFILDRTNDGNSPSVDTSNVTHATRPI